MKAITVCQPYADMIRNLEKPLENRSWSTSYRGPIAIHAGKSRAWLEADDETERPGMAFGAVVATARLVDCLPVDSLPAHLRDHDEANGPFCLVLEDVEPVDPPIPARGALGLWEWQR